MARVRYTDDLPSAPVGYELWQPGEERDVTDAEAEELCRNVHFTLVAPPPPAPVEAPVEAAPEPPAAPAEPPPPAQGG